ncbi:lysylphosphatidylglycerol synthase transmembrane domain-containing protein [Lacimicrobium alkaliphilum]|uniref:Phosphatidylglycerol lysyltransferase n=1 Tax=Lacimicrobium alkaliphilum TaxID=1526571 RepID=A0ABQ1R2I8_9ALTE|nr:lysylphosphatidylglycerol synthase transmembrane domain-containing protein [Lacimicrobium alkaliphilum]GGD55021.1 phosphatidylglycerol lysyltransferase [Lacimicrobium alkaliphilum]
MTDSVPESPLRRHTVRWIYSAVLFVGLSIGVPLLIFYKVDAQSISINPMLYSWPVMLSVFVLILIYFTSDALRLSYILKASGHQLKWRHRIKITFINMLFSNITPLATGGGFAQIWYLRRLNIPVGTATAATTVRTFIAMALIFLPIPLLVMNLPFFDNNAVMTGAGWLLSIVALTYIACFLIMLFRLRWLLNVIDRIAGVLIKIRLVSAQSANRRKRQVLRETVRFSHSLEHCYLRNRRDIILSVFFTAVFLLSLFSFPCLLLWGSGYDAGYLATTGLVAIQTSLMYFAPSPGGAGFAEGLFGLFFTDLLSTSELVGIILIWRFLTIYLGMLIGIPVILHELFCKKAKE